MFAAPLRIRAQPDWQLTGTLVPVEATIDSVGRVVLPKQLRDRLGLMPGGKVDISLYGDGLHIAPTGRTARLEERGGRLVAISDTPVTDDDILGLVDSIRR